MWDAIGEIGNWGLKELGETRVCNENLLAIGFGGVEVVGCCCARLVIFCD